MSQMPLVYVMFVIILLAPREIEALTFKYGVSGAPIICVPAADVPNDALSFSQSSLHIKIYDAPVALITFRYSTDTFIKAIPKFHINPEYSINDPPNVIFGEVSIVNTAYTRRSLGRAAGSDVEDIWHKKGRCVHPIIEPVPFSTTFLAKCGDGEFWHILFDREPGVAPRPDDVFTTVLGECTHMSGGAGAHANSELENCVRRIFVSNFRVDYHFELENAGSIPGIDNFVRSRIYNWRQNCTLK